MTVETRRRLQLWLRQVATLVRSEVGRRLFGRGAIVVYVLAAIPIVIALPRFLFLGERMRSDLGAHTSEFCETFHYFVLLFVVFLACAGLFIHLIKAEVLNRSLHYLLLAPMRRSVLVVGKYLGGLAAALLVLLPMTVLTFVLFFLPLGPTATWQYLTSAAGLGQLAGYLGLVALACMGYGAIALLFGLLWRNPLIAALGVLGWEYAVPFMPAPLKVLSVAHHLRSLSPVPVPHGYFALLADPTPAWLAVLGLMAFTAALLVLCTLAARRLEITYASE
jgi:ABC-type transport system involved in multi-copper enzyme maturation permease subunit